MKCNNLKIVIVDADISNSLLVNEYLKRFSFKSKILKDEEEILNVLLIEKPDIILIGFNHRKRNLQKVLDQVKILSPETRIILMTALPENEISSTLVKLGLNEYINKPFNSNHFFNILTSCHTFEHQPTTN